MSVLAMNLQAQLPAYYEPYKYYREAVELFDKEVYEAASQRFETFLQESPETHGNDVHANARFYHAACAYHLDRNDAEAVLLKFIKDYPETSRTGSAYYYLSKYFFDKKQYKQSLEPLLAAEASGTIPDEHKGELNFMIGYAYYKQKDNAKAKQYLSQAAGQKNPFQEEAKYHLAVIQYSDGDYAGAYDSFKPLAKSKKYKGDVIVYMANCLLELKRYKELDQLGTELMADPTISKKNPQVYFILANSSFENQDYRKAAEYFRAYRGAKGRLNAGAYFRFGFSEYKEENYKEAVPLLDKVLTMSKFGSGSDSIPYIASYYLGFCYLRQKDAESAKFAFKQTANANQLNNSRLKEDALYQYAQLCFGTKDYNESLNAFYQMESEYPNSPHSDEARSMIGELLFYSKNYPKAIEYLESVPLNSPRSRKAYQTVCYYYALSLVEKKEYKKSDDYFKKAIDFSHDAELTLSSKFWLGESRFRQNWFDESIKNYKTYIESSGAKQNEFYPLASYGLGWAYFKEKKYTSSLKNFEDFISQKNRNTESRLLVDAYLRSGDCLFLKRDYGNSIDMYKEVVKLKYTQSDYALYQVGEAKYRIGNYSGSVESFKELVNQHKKSELRDNALDRISVIYLDWIKDNAKSTMYSKLLVSDYPKSPLAADAYNRLALAAYFDGNEKEAVDYFMKVLDDYTYDKKNCQIALDNLSAILPPAKFDKIMKDYLKKNPTVDEGLAELTLNTGKDRFFSENYNSAIEQFSSYIEKFPNGANFYEALLYRARSYEATNRNNKALNDYAKIYNAVPKNEYTNTAYLEAAELQFAGNKYMESLQLYQLLEQSASAVPNKVQAKFGIAKNYMAMGDYTPAKVVLSEIESNPEAAIYSRSKAKVQIGMCEYYQGSLDAALILFQEVEGQSKNEFGAQSQYMITQIFYDKKKYQESKDAGLYLKNNYPTFNYWKAKAFLIVAECNVELGNVFQAKGVLESLIAEDRFPEIKEAAEKRLEELLEMEQQAGEGQ